ncbi:hypothetical protein, partial [Nocardia abscessus]|uniref:hypothetical protein n=1 Tax=Nocardia abscessus TaxID=120957 RepID=UPI0024567651
MTWTTTPPTTADAGMLGLALPTTTQARLSQLRACHGGPRQPDWGVSEKFGSCALPVVMHSVLSQQDSMSKKPEPGSAVHLPFQELRFRVDALARA